MKIRKSSGRLKKAIVAVAILLFIIIITSIIIRRSKTDCDKWLFQKSTGIKINSVDDAIAAFRPFLQGEKHYSDHLLPTTIEGFKDKYNLEPFISTEVVKDKEGKWVDKEVYNMLLAYLFDRDGNIYKYNICSLFY